MTLPPDLVALARLGWHVAPTAPRSRAYVFSGAIERATDDPLTLTRWHRAYPGCGWRVVCGPSGLFALDVDRAGPTHRADGFAALRALVAKHGPLPPCPATVTGGSGGAALFFRHAGEPLRGASGALGAGLDPLRGRQGVMVPPSLHPATERAYGWREGRAPWEVSPPPIPLWLARLLRPAPVPTHAWTPTTERADGVLIEAVGIVCQAPSGYANITLNRQAYRLGRWVAIGMIMADDARAHLLVAASRRGIPEREAQATIQSGLKAGQRKPVQARHVG